MRPEEWSKFCKESLHCPTCGGKLVAQVMGSDSTPTLQCFGNFTAHESTWGRGDIDDEIVRLMRQESIPGDVDEKS